MKFKLNLDQVDEILSEFGVTVQAAKQVGAHLRSRPSRTGRKSPAQIEQENLEAVERSRDLDKIENPSEHVVLAAIRRDGKQIRFVEDPPESLQMEAFRSKNAQSWIVSDIIQCIKNPTEEVKLTAVRLNGNSLEHVPHPWSHELMLEAVRRDGKVLEIIQKHLKSDPPEDICFAAISQNPFAIEYISDPTEEMQLAAVRQSGDALGLLKKPSYEVKLAAVRQSGDSVRHVGNPTSELQFEAVRQSPASIRFIKNAPEEIQLEAVRQSPFGSAFRNVNNPTEAVKIEAVSRDGMLIASIKNPTKEVKLAAVRQNGHALQYLKSTPVYAKQDELEELELEAVKQNWQAIEYVMNPSEAVLREFLTSWVTEVVMKS